MADSKSGAGIYSMSLEHPLVLESNKMIKQTIRKSNNQEGVPKNTEAK